MAKNLRTDKSKDRRRAIGLALLALVLLLIPTRGASAQGTPPPGVQPAAPPPILPPPNANIGAQSYSGSGGAAALLGTPVSPLFPGGVGLAKAPAPNMNDKQAALRGMQNFTSFNCVGCHAPNGGGGMGPSLSNRTFLYGHDPANIYLSIYQGRPNGMPAWGGVLPDSAIWDLVAYITSISKAPSPQWGTTVSATKPEIEQVPAQYVVTPRPWDATEAFSNGRKSNANFGRQP